MGFAMPRIRKLDMQAFTAPTLTKRPAIPKHLLVQLKPGEKICKACYQEEPDNPAHYIHPIDNFFAGSAVCKPHYYKKQHQSRSATPERREKQLAYNRAWRKRDVQEAKEPVPDGWIHAAEASREWGVSREWVRQLILKKKVVSRKINGRDYIDPESYDPKTINIKK